MEKVLRVVPCGSDDDVVEGGQVLHQFAQANTTGVGTDWNCVNVVFSSDTSAPVPSLLYFRAMSITATFSLTLPKRQASI